MKLSAPVRITQHSTRVRTTVWPPRQGTLQPLIEYGSDLICVRYRYDAKRQRRYKTVELIIEEVPWSRMKKRKR